MDIDEPETSIPTVLVPPPASQRESEVKKDKGKGKEREKDSEQDKENVPESQSGGVVEDVRVKQEALEVIKPPITPFEFMFSNRGLCVLCVKEYVPRIFLDNNMLTFFQ